MSGSIFDDDDDDDSFILPARPFLVNIDLVVRSNFFNGIYWALAKMVQQQNSRWRSRIELIWAFIVLALIRLTIRYLFFWDICYKSNVIRVSRVYCIKKPESNLIISNTFFYQFIFLELIIILLILIFFLSLPIKTENFSFSQQKKIAN